MNEFELWLSSAAQATGTEALLWIAARIAMAAVLGGFIAILYRDLREATTRKRGFAQTLVMLAPLIAMVTMAVGQNIAAAFTLVGTLAIVRFRTVVRDTRDMAFVIFSVAAGMAMGAFNLMVALSGCVIIGLVIVALRDLEQRAPTEHAAILRLVISPPEANPTIYESTLKRYADSHSIVRSAVDRNSRVLDLRLTVFGVDPEQSAQLLTELLEIPEVVRASFAPDDAN